MTTKGKSLLVLSVLFLLIIQSDSIDIHVAESSTNTNCQDTTSSNPCNDLDAALKLISDKSNSVLTISSGQYQLPESASYTFTGVTDVTIIGINGPVQVLCSQLHESLSGFDFISSKNLKIQNVDLIGCGMEFNSTARNFSTDQFELLPVAATLYFQSCESVILSSVTINESLGIAIQMYSTYGTVEISNCTFASNGLNQTTGEGISRWGGGVYIEFPFCAPGNNSCNLQNTSSVNISTVSNSNYLIKNTIFDSNVAHDPAVNHMILAYHTYHKATGRGGGLSIFFKGQAYDNTFTIDTCTFNGNSAVYGGGVYVEMQDSSHGNLVTITNSHFTNNVAKYEGAGLLVSYLFLKELTGDEVRNCSVILRSNHFIGNSFRVDGDQPDEGSGIGGGVSYTTTRQTNSDDKSSLNKFAMFDTSFIDNTGFIGSGLKVSAYSLEDNGYLYPVTISNFWMENNTVGNEGQSISTHVGSGAMYVTDMLVQFSGNVTFIDNNDTALSVFNSKIETLKDTYLLFSNNHGYDGGAFALQSSSVLLLNENVKLRFQNNKAFNRGAAIFNTYSNPSITIQAQNCFIQYSDTNKSPNEWKVRVEFEENEVLVRNNGESLNNAIYSSSLYPCILGRPYGMIESNIEEQLRKVFCWNENWTYEGTYGSCGQYINTDVSRLIQDDMSTRMKIIPGQSHSMGIIAKDEQNNTINSTIILHPSSLKEGVQVEEGFYYTSNNHIKLLNYDNTTNKTFTAIIQIDTVDQIRHVRAKFEVDIVVPCPPGFQLLGGACICNKTFGGVLRWKYSDENDLVAEILSGYWIGPLDKCLKEGEETAKVIATHCKYCDFDKVKNGYYTLGQNFSSVQDDLCGPNRTGQICSECKGDYKPAIDVDKFSCVQCNGKGDIAKGVAMFVALDVILPLLFIIFLGLMNVPLTNGLLHGPIFFAQMITSVVTLDADGVIQYHEMGTFANYFNRYFEEIYIFFYDIFNMEFFMFTQKYCIGLSHFSKVVALHFSTAFIPIGFVFLCWILFRCFDGQSRFDTEARIKTWLKENIRLPELFAACILLSYTKILLIACYLLAPISLVSYDGHYGDYSHSVLYVDGSICYGSNKGLFIFSLVVAVVFLIPIPLILMLCRYNTNVEQRGFFESIVKEFQKDFKENETEYEAIHAYGANRRCCPNGGCKSRDDATCTCDCECCGGCLSFQNVNRYECACCTRGYTCRYYQQQSRWCCFCINVSFSFLDLRWLSGMSFVVRLIMILPYLLAWTTIIRYTIQLSICMFAGMLILVIKPYKRNLYKYVDCNRVEACSFFNLAFILALCIYQFHYSTTPGLHLSKWAYVIQVILVSAPFIWIAVVYCILVKEKHPKIFSYCCGKGVPDEDNSLNAGSHAAVRDASVQSKSESIPLMNKSVDTDQELVDSYEPRPKSTAFT